MSRLERKDYSIKGKTKDEVVELIRMLLGYKGEVYRLVVTRGNLLVEFVVEDEGPPFGKVPESPAEHISDVLAKVDMQALKPGQEVKLDALAKISSALIQTRRERRSGVAWVVSDPANFHRWLGLERPIERLLDVPIYEVSKDDLPPDKVVLLCAATSIVSPLDSDLGIVLAMEDEDDKVN